MDIKIRYILKKEEYLEGFDKYESSKISFKIDMLISLFLIGLGVYLFTINKDIQYTLLAIIFSLIGICTLVPQFRLSRLIVGFQFEQNKKSKVEQLIEFSDEGLNYFIENANSKIKWDFYNDFLVGEKTLILIYGKRQFSVIPKSSFTDAQLNELIEFCRKKLRPTNGST